MANVIKNQSYYGSHPYGTSTYLQSYKMVNLNPAFYGEGQWNFYTNQYVYLGSVYANVGSNIVNSFKFTIDQYGCKNFELRLTEQPSFPVQANTVLKFGYNNDIYFTGFISDYPQPGESQDGIYIYRGFGGIHYTSNTFYSAIKQTTITQALKSGSNTIYTINDPTQQYLPEANGYVAVSDASNSKNNGVHRILSATYTNPSWTVTTDNANGVTTNPEIGLIKLYPAVICQTNVLVSDMVKYIGSQYINEGSTFVSYDSANIETTTGILISGVLDFYNKTYYEIFQILNQFVKDLYSIGVDENGKMYCKKFASTPVDKYFIGFNAPSADLKLNIDGVRNYITVKRKKSTGSNQVGRERGFAPSQTALVQESIGTYGRKEFNVELPGYYSDSVCQSVADRLFTVYSQPQYQANIRSMPFKKYPINNYGVVSAYNQNIVTLIDSCETTSKIKFSYQNTNAQIFDVRQPSYYGGHQYGRVIYQQASTSFISNISLSTLYVKGAKSVLVNVQDGFPINTWTEFIDITLPANTILTKSFVLSFYIYCGKANIQLQLEHGSTIYTSNPVLFAPLNQWNRYDIPVTLTSTVVPSYFRIWCKSSQSSFSFNIDNIVLLQSLNEHINLNLYEANYSLDPTSSKVDLTLGQAFNRLDNFLASVVNGQRTNGYYLDV
jgi:hypothetical protein